MMQKRGRQLTPREKEAMSEGRERSRIIDKYLRELATGKYHKRGPGKADPASIKAELADLDTKLATAEGIQKLLLTQKREQLTLDLEGRGDEDKFQQLEQAFMRVARQFSADRGISYNAWRDMGVPARVLLKAKIFPPQSRSRSEDPD
jgi:hypothetical protein